VIQNQATGQNPIIPTFNWIQNLEMVLWWNMLTTHSKISALFTFSDNSSLNLDFHDFFD
jgi:hypothetical protein